MARIIDALEMRAISRKEIVDYFIEIGGNPQGGETYTGDNWEVSIAEQATFTIGSLSLPSVKVTFSIEEAFHEDMLSKFRLRFLRGGA